MANRRFPQSVGISNEIPRRLHLRQGSLLHLLTLHGSGFSDADRKHGWCLAGQIRLNRYPSEYSLIHDKALASAMPVIELADLKSDCHQFHVTSDIGVAFADYAIY